ncbi:MAG: hypothetical protein OEW15_16885 [Nitrospirota bacterium]|nr:hypothetical protein [Nitrospirota bacterium]
MDKDILNEVIEAEKNIQRCLEAEQARLALWLDQVRRDAEESVRAEERNNGDSGRLALEEAKRDAAARARQVVAEAEQQARSLARLDDSTLAGIVMKRIPRILME